MAKKRFNSVLYTKGKFGKRLRETLDTDNELLYSHGRYATKIREEDLPEDYAKIHSRAIWYMTGYLKTSGVRDVRFRAINNNHLFKDDYLFISYDEPIVEVVDQWGLTDFDNYDVAICGPSIIPVVLAIEKHSDVDTTEVRKRIQEKVLWYKENHADDYKRQFGNEPIDVFERYKNA